MEDAVNEANAGALVGVLIGQLDVDLPEPSLEWRYSVSKVHEVKKCSLTIFRPLESDIELLPILCQLYRATASAGVES